MYADVLELHASFRGNSALLSVEKQYGRLTTVVSYGGGAAAANDEVVPPNMVPEYVRDVSQVVMHAQNSTPRLTNCVYK